MLYNLAEGPPEPGTLLESVFLLVTKRRMEAQYLGVRAVMEAVLRPHTEQNTLDDAHKMYISSMFPHIERDKERRDKASKEAMKNWVGRGPLTVRALDSPDMRRDRRRAKNASLRREHYLATRPEGKKL